MKRALHSASAALLVCSILLSAQTTVPPEKPGELDILSDTMGVDFGPYLNRVCHDVRMNWYNVIPEAAYPPQRKKGTVAIQFYIMKDGSVAGMKLESPSGDVSFDRAAWGGITASNPFPPLPTEFSGQYLLLRFWFYYNPDAAELYKTKCATCHGADGKGDTPTGPRLGVRDFHSPQVVEESDQELLDITKNGKDKMPKYDGKLTDDQIKALVKYIRALK